jgi:UDP-N-acetylmuramate--alanine ligase
MHIFFSGIGGGAIGPLAIMAKQAGYEVSGSDKQESLYIDNLRKQGINPLIGQTTEDIAKLHAEHPIDWVVYSSAIPKENPNHPELVFAEEHGIKHSKRDELLNILIKDNDLKLIAIAGTHGKTTTTAMVVWLFRELGQKISYSVGAKMPFGPQGHFEPGSTYFVYECDEFDRNFLAFHPHFSLITGISWDHHEIFPTREDYNQAFQEFISQSEKVIIWDRDLQYLDQPMDDHLYVADLADPTIDSISLDGRFNREDAWMAIRTVAGLTGKSFEELRKIIETFPGSKQRMELLAPGLYTNYAHTPEKIRGGMSAAKEIAAKQNKDLVVIYEPLTNRRQHYIKEDYKDCFEGAKKLYWVPTYLAREDPTQELLKPADLIPYLDNAAIAEPAELDDALMQKIHQHLDNGDLVVAMGASGGGSMDEWLRDAFASKSH